jgi:ankyrin repeat protein
MIAGFNYQNEILSDLFNKGADPQAKDNRKQSLLALLMAVQNYEGLLITLDTMNARGIALDKALNEMDEDGYTPLAWAVEQQDFPAAKILLEHGAKPDVPEAGATSPLQLADHLESAQMLRLLKQYQSE